MRKGRPLWKDILYIGIGAFALGLFPYLWEQLPEQILAIREGGVSLAPQARAVVEEAWNLVVEFGPLIIALYVIFTAVLIFFEGQNPDRTILWLVTLAFLPVFGILLYMLLGPDMKRLQRKKRFKPTRAYPCASGHLRKTAPGAVRKLAVLGYRSAGADILERGRVKILVNGEETFAEIKSRLRAAEKYIHMEYFIIQDDALGHEIRDILVERANAGVKIRVAFDAVGSWKLGRKYIETLRDAGVEIHSFLPVSFPVFRSGLNFRNHRKIIIIDGLYAFMGGLNIGEEYLGRGPLGRWRDTHALFEGDAVKALHKVFIDDWNFCAHAKLDADSPEFLPMGEARGSYPELPVQIVKSGSDSVWHSIEQAYFTMITEANERIWITSPYLVPGQSILYALKAAALAGVDVRLLIPDESDHFLVYWAGRSNIEDLLRAGVRVWRYTNGFVHAKTIVMDDSVSSVGTANLDVRSLEINFEVQSFIYDGALNEEFARRFEADTAESVEFVLSEWEKRPLHHKALESLGRLWSSQI